MIPNLKAYTDGSCRRDSGIGGWAVVYVINNIAIKYISNREYNTTSPRMELTAILEALINSAEPIEIISDSQYALYLSSSTWEPKRHKDIINEIRKYKAAKYTRVMAHTKESSGDEYWNYIVDKLAWHAAYGNVDKAILSDPNLVVLLGR